MHLARRSTRFLAALTLTGMLVGSSPLAPTALAASPPANAARIRAVFCDYVARAIALLETQRQTPLRDFLLAELRKVQASRCG